MPHLVATALVPHSHLAVLRVPNRKTSPPRHKDANHSLCLGGLSFVLLFIHGVSVFRCIGDSEFLILDAGALSVVFPARRVSRPLEQRMLAGAGARHGQDKDGWPDADFRSVIAMKVRNARTDKDVFYLRPETLFRKSNFEQSIGELA